MKDFQLTQTFESEDTIIAADPLHFNNIITNILDNAVKYSSEKKRIAIRTKENWKHLEISISDNGNGITKDQLGKVFTKFYRVPTGNLHNVKGFGLGLYYVKNICDAHKWSIDVDSEIGEGTCFKIKIPTTKS